jgi:Histidine kinase-like ATPase domain
MPDPDSIVVFGYGVLPERLTDIAQRHGWHIAASPRGSNAAIVGPIGGTHLTQILAEPISFCVEDQVADALIPGEGLLTVTLSANLAYKVGLAGILVDALTLRGWIDARDRATLLLVMNEALSNAIIHGDLELESLTQNSAGAFIQFAAALEHRLSTPAFGGKAVQISAEPYNSVLRICVRDQGRGFSQQDIDRSTMGRGLSLIRENTEHLDYEEGGRKTVICFHRKKTC